MTGENTPPNPENDGLPRVDLRGKKSLRKIAPEYWRPDGKTISFRSVIASYATGPIEKKVSPNVAQFIKENCRSARRLRIMAISAYESFASLHILPSWASIGTMTFLALTAGVSTLDALACVLWGTVFGEAPEKEEQIPGMNRLRTKLFGAKHPFHDPVTNLLESEWCKKLYEARNRVVHRGFWPAVTSSGDFVLYQNLETFEFGARTGSQPKKERSLDLVTIMRGLLCELETWDTGIEPALKSAACFTPYVTGPIEIQSLIDGQAECDWCIETEIDYHNPTKEFVEEWKAHREKTSTTTSEDAGTN